jgi:G3E family GTPase
MTSSAPLPPPFPVHVLTGPLGVGKTTAIAHLLGTKAEEERWAVILNEFTETGIDALTLAAAARGAYDVRLVPGGCLCCASELDFTRTLVQLVHEQRPVRLLVEPSGIGHPAAIAEELLQHEARGHLELAGIICLLDGLRAERLWAEWRATLAAEEAATTPPERSVERDQFEVADVVVLSKADVATPEQRAAFQSLAAAAYPPKRWVGEMTQGELPAEALLPRGATSRPPVFLPARPTLHAAAQHEHGGRDEAVSLRWPASGEGEVVRRITRRLGRVGVSWVFPTAWVFARLPLLRFLEKHPVGGVDAAATELHEVAGTTCTVERAKGVVRTGPYAWWSLQSFAGGVGARESQWRLDSRLEVMFLPAEAEAGLADAIAAWEQALQQSLAVANAAPVNLA